MKSDVNVTSIQESDYVYIILDSFLSSVKSVFAYWLKWIKNQN